VQRRGTSDDQAIAELDVRILSWNIRANTGITSKRVERIVDAIARDAPDVVLLQEVTARGGVPARLAARLRDAGLIGFHFSGSARSAKPYGNVIASRFAVQPVRARLAPAPPWPQLLARAVIDTPRGSIEAISVHMPNGSTYGWKKIDTFEALGSILAHRYRAPLIVGGDFNEPQSIGPGNQIISFGADADGIVRGHWKRGDRRHPAALWQRAVDAVLGPTSIVRHAWLAKNSRAETTHTVRGAGRFFDHVLVSVDHFRVVDAGYRHVWRRGRNAMSDHSGAWAVVRRAT
jgi:endonuclease/exonuclease/phosphatase family metal-dependent hydrolase